MDENGEALLAPPFPTTYDIKSFSMELGTHHRHGRDWGVRTVEYRRHYGKHLQHDSLVLRVIPLLPGTYIPRRGTTETFLEVERVAETLSLLGGHAVDRVIPHGYNHPILDERERRAVLYWSSDFPYLIDIVTASFYLHFTNPKYALFTRRSYLYASSIYEVLCRAYPHRMLIEATNWRGRKSLSFLLSTPFTPVSTPSSMLRMLLSSKKYTDAYVEETAQKSRLLEAGMTGY